MGGSVTDGSHLQPYWPYLDGFSLLTLSMVFEWLAAPQDEYVSISDGVLTFGWDMETGLV